MAVQLSLTTKGKCELVGVMGCSLWIAASLTLLPSVCRDQTHGGLRRGASHVDTKGKQNSQKQPLLTCRKKMNGENVATAILSILHWSSNSQYNDLFALFLCSLRDTQCVLDDIAHTQGCGRNGRVLLVNKRELMLTKMKMNP